MAACLSIIAICMANICSCIFFKRGIAGEENMRATLPPLCDSANLPVVYGTLCVEGGHLEVHDDLRRAALDSLLHWAETHARGGHLRHARVVRLQGDARVISRGLFQLLEGHVNRIVGRRRATLRMRRHGADEEHSGHPEKPTIPHC